MSATLQVHAPLEVGWIYMVSEVVDERSGSRHDGLWLS